ncbi:GNAT family acetyltransferase [Aspergillus sclerotialis]|uniref:GNAT family acetyltransferase n=1 Tax=Aspergillus sclerotialis TaxID=2070753 RepID=A0A3A2ZRI3_9EURO|nr:GNAT family acetyltransferase [Aspergillus sclerotialis]
MGTDKVIGGIRCRLERLPATTTELLNSQSKSRQEPANLYIQTLHLLSPYRGRGVAASLLNSLLFSSPPGPGLDGGEYQVSDLVKHYNIRTVTAHVHEANDDALQWYISRGFIVQDGVVENYYRRLKPSGARIVKFVLNWNGRDAGEVGSTSSTANAEGNESRAEGDKDEDDWEKVEPEEADEHDHGVQPLSGSRVLESEESGRKKRKMDDC